jgi:hypothetical protein
MINDQLFVRRDETQLRQIIDECVKRRPPAPDTDLELALPKRGQWNMEVYQDEPRYEAVRNYLRTPIQARCSPPWNMPAFWEWEEPEAGHT